MALIQCKECGKPVSTEADVCPHCGAPQQLSAPPPLPVQPLHTIQQKSGIPEETIYSDNVVTVTTTRVIILGTTYALRNITSVRIASTPPQIGWAILLLIFGISILLLAIMPFNEKSKAPVGVYIIASAMLGGAILWMFKAKTTFHVDLSSASGEIHALTSKDKAYTQRIVQSINEAIVKYQ